MRRAFLILAESVLLQAIGQCAAYIRLSEDAWWETIHNHGWAKLLLAAMVIQFAFYLFDLYDLHAIHNYRRVVINLAKALTVASLLLLLVFYLVPRLLLGRGVFLVMLLLTAVVIATWRLAMAYATGHPKLGVRERVLILGSGEQAIKLARAAIELPSAGFQIVGFVDDKPELVGKSLVNPTVIGVTENLPELVRQHRVDRIVVAVEDRRGKFPIEELLNLRLSGAVAIEEGARFYERLTGKLGIEILRPSWLIFSQGSRYSDVAQHLRRVINAGLAAIGFVVSLPIMIIIAIAIKLDSRGPILYLQERVGRNGRIFKMIKFRSMRVGAEANGPVWASKSDRRVTRVGRIIRKLRLDELPQFINVLRGDMNFIGPRPERPEFVKQLSQLIPYYPQRHLIKPGLTGWAQINHPYGASIEDAIEKLKYDLYYIKNQSLLLDAIIIFETVRTILFGRGSR
jgi:sugar transferase (PEP-CTERM system associated)